VHVHITHPPDPEDLDMLRNFLDPDILITTGEIKKDHHSAVILVAGGIAFEELQKFSNLKVMVVPWTGIPLETLSIVKKIPDLKLHNLHHNAVPVAEMVIALLMAAAKMVIPFDRELRKGDWKLRYQLPVVPLLAGKRALILGYGEIGRRVGPVLEAMGIETKAIRRSSALTSDIDIHSPDELLEILPNTDILILALPHTAETDGLIGKKELALLPDTALLINVSRGKVVDQEALYLALKERRLFGAGLDVWYNYPPDKESRSNTIPGDFPFHELDNLVLSPHRAGLVREIEHLRMRALADLLNAAARKQKLPNEVNLDLGY